MPKTKSSASSTSPAANLNYKSPKPDLWKAYKELVENVDKAGAEKTSEKITKQTSTLTKNWIDRINHLHASLQQEVEAIETEFKQAASVLSDLADAQQSLEKQMTAEEEEAKKSRQRETEENEYEFEKQKKRQQEELAEHRQKTLDELEQKKAKLTEQEDELQDLRNQAKTFDARLEKAVQEAVKATTAELDKEFQHEKELAEQKAEAAQDLLTQKIESLTKTVSDLKNENQKLNQLLVQTSANLTNIAEKAVEKGSSSQEGYAGHSQKQSRE